MSVRIPRDDRNEVARIVDAFRDLKSNLGLRPNYHQKENRVDDNSAVIQDLTSSP